MGKASLLRHSILVISMASGSSYGPHFNLLIDIVMKIPNRFKMVETNHNLINITILAVNVQIVIFVEL